MGVAWGGLVITLIFNPKPNGGRNGWGRIPKYQLLLCELELLTESYKDALQIKKKGSVRPESLFSLFTCRLQKLKITRSQCALHVYTCYWVLTSQTPMNKRKPVSQYCWSYNLLRWRSKAWRWSFWPFCWLRPVSRRLIERFLLYWNQVKPPT